MSTPLRRRLALVLAVAAAGLAVPAAGAQAKGLVGLTVCGADRCVDRTPLVRARATLAEDLLQGGVMVADDLPAPFVRLEERIGDGGKAFGAATSVVYF